jgi:hypothetical protein
MAHAMQPAAAGPAAPAAPRVRTVPRYSHVVACMCALYVIIIGVYRLSQSKHTISYVRPVPRMFYQNTDWLSCCVLCVLCLKPEPAFSAIRVWRLGLGLGLGYEAVYSRSRYKLL